MTTVVIVGGGIRGSFLAKQLQDQDQCNVILIAPKEYIEIPCPENSIINRIEFLPKARIIVSTAVGINDTEVVTAHGDHIAYDYLVIATGGHLHSGGCIRLERLNHFQAECQKIRSSNSILILEGGPTEVELSSEICTDLHNKKVTQVTRGKRLLEFIGLKSSKKSVLVSKKVEVILGQLVELSSPLVGVYATSGGEILRTDCACKCIGQPMGVVRIRETNLATTMDGCGRLIMNGNFTLKGYKNVFAIGDITGIPVMIRARI